MAKLDRVNAILESDGEKFAADHEDLLVEAMVHTSDFQKHMKAFILNNSEEFIGEDIEDTYKNVRVFSEVATAQFVNEITTLFGTQITEEEVVQDQGIQEYL